MEERDPLTQAVIGAAIEVHRLMGPGLLESVYQACLQEELRLRGMAFSPQHRLPLVYKDKPLADVFILDFYFPGQLVVELKAVEKLLPFTKPNSSHTCASARRESASCSTSTYPF